MVIWLLQLNTCETMSKRYCLEVCLAYARRGENQVDVITQLPVVISIT